MGLVHETIEEVGASYGETMRSAREARQRSLGEAVDELGIDRSHTYETEDPDAAFIHFLGDGAFQHQAFTVFNNFTSQIRGKLGEDGRLPVLFEGIHRNGRHRLPIEPEYVRPWYTSLAVIEGSKLIMQSSVETRPDIKADWNQTMDMTIRRLGIVAKTATTRADLGNDEQVQEAIDQPITEGSVLPLYLQAEASYGPQDKRTIYPAFADIELHNFLPHEITGSGIGWGEIVSTLEREMSFGRDLHYHHDIGVPPDLTDGDKHRYVLINDLVSSLGISSDEQAYIDYLYDLPNLSAKWPESNLAA